MGEEYAVVHYLNGCPQPSSRSGRSSAVTGADQPEPPETLAQIALVARYGDHSVWRKHRAIRDRRWSASPARWLPGVYELAFGSVPPPAARSSSRRCWSAATSAPGSTRRGPSSCGSRATRSVGCSLGSGVLIALGDFDWLGLHESARVIDYLGPPVPAGRVYGLRAIADAVGALADGVGPSASRWTSEVNGRGAPSGAARFVESALEERVRR